MDWSIQDIARLAGTTSRTLRHYGDVGLLPASRVGDNGYRYYDELALVRLQRILMLRDLGLGIPGTPQVNGRPAKQYLVGLGEMYVADDRFGANYGGVAGASFVRDALAVYAERNL